MKEILCYVKVSREMLKNESFIFSYLEANLRPNRIKGRKFLTASDVSGPITEHGDLFVKNLAIFTRRFYCFKVPRILNKRK